MLISHSQPHPSPFIKDWPRALALAVSSSLAQLSPSPRSPPLSAPKTSSCPGIHPYTCLPLPFSIPTPVWMGCKPGGLGNNRIRVLSAGSKAPSGDTAAASGPEGSPGHLPPALPGPPPASVLHHQADTAGGGDLLGAAPAHPHQVPHPCPPAAPRAPVLGLPMGLAPFSTCRCAVQALKVLLCSVGLQRQMEAIQEQGGWDALLSTVTQLQGVQVVAR